LSGTIYSSVAFHQLNQAINRHECHHTQLQDNLIRKWAQIAASLLHPLWYWM